MYSIIGKGLLANSFQTLQCEGNVLVFASGVSNSRELNENCFEREILLIKKTLIEHSDKIFIYFSSTSVYSNTKSPYIKHKLIIEEIIKKSSEKFLIIRLPQVVGNVINTTLIPYIVNKILTEEYLEIQKNSSRFLIDVEDVVRIINIIINSKYLNLVIDLEPKTAAPVLDIVKEIEFQLSIQAKIRLVEYGESYSGSPSFIQKLLPPTDIIFEQLYWKFILKKYIPAIKQSFLSNKNK